MNIPAIVAVREVEDVGLLSNNHRLVETLRSALGSGDHAYATVPTLIEEVIEEKAWPDRLDSNGGRYRAKTFSDFIQAPAPNGLGLNLDIVRRYLGDSGNPNRTMFEEAIEASKENHAWPEQSRSNDGSFMGRHPNVIRMTPDKESPSRLVATKVDTGSKVVAAKPISAPVAAAAVPSPPVVVSIPKRDRSREPQAGTSVGYAVRRLNRERPDLLEKVESGKLSAHAAAVEAGFREKSITIPAEPVAAARRLVKHFTREQFEELSHAALAAYDAAPASATQEAR